MVTRELALTENYFYYLPDTIKKEQVLFFDIETTGFAADVTVVYLIGCLYFKDNSWYLKQWFADDNKSEEQIIRAFFEFSKKFCPILHYNGTGFDLPYLYKKCEAYQLSYKIDDNHSLDIYRRLSLIKNFLKTENLKQRTLEQFLGINRTDPFSGKELIEYYGNFLKAKYGHLPEEKNYYNMLLLHNEEDLKGLLQITPLLTISDALLNDIKVKKATIDIEKKELVLSLSLFVPVIKRIQFGKQEIYFSAFKQDAVLRIHLYQNELKYFYSNYKDYYYLPEEDMAIHKSVAFYVDKNFRTRAKAANCYSKRTGCFVPQYEVVIEPYFKIDYFDKITYIETTEEFCEDKQALSKYARHLLDYLLSAI